MLIAIHKFRFVAIFIALLLGLVACKKSNVSSAGGGNIGTDNSSQTYPLIDQDGYSKDIQRDSEGRIINPLTAPANQTYYFDFDGTAIGSGDLEAIRVQANYLANHPAAVVRLEGNTGNRGSREYNVGLGLRRSQAVADILKQNGVSPKQIALVSYGKERPAVEGNNESAWKLNRRVSLVYESQ